MENKCNKTPNSNNSCTKFYSSEGKKNYIRSGTNNNNNEVVLLNNNDMPTPAEKAAILLKENKQLKAMLILHLNLIQEQNEQILAKDKQLNGQSDELERLHERNSQLELQVQELQKQLQRHIKRAALPTGELSSPPPLAKIQCKAPAETHIAQIVGNLAQGGPSQQATANIIGECNGKLISKIILQRVNLGGHEEEHESFNSSYEASETASEDCIFEPLSATVLSISDADNSILNTVPNEIVHEIDDDIDEADAEGEDDDDDDDSQNADQEPSDEQIEQQSTDASEQQHVENRSLTLMISRGAKPRHALPNAHATASNSTVASGNDLAPKTVASQQFCITPPTPSRGKQMPLMLWHAPYMNETDESASCDSMPDAEHQHSLQNPTITDASANQNDIKAKKPTRAQGNSSRTRTTIQASQNRSKGRRCPFISTSQLYSTREWEDLEFDGEFEFIKEEENEVQTDVPTLEIPKWTEHELSVSYCIEGTEDLSDETYLKRHAKLELDEKRRKKWDVQQIREQRRIEKLKRRHCKDEISNSADQFALQSFYPQPETVETIYFVHDLPVQAFGEIIPKISASDFVLPWLVESITCNANSTAPIAVPTVLTMSQSSPAISTAQSQQLVHNSSFVFLKKRKRQQSHTTATSAGGTCRQRTVTKAAATTVATVSVPVTSTSSSSSTNTTLMVTSPLMVTQPIAAASTADVQQTPLLTNLGLANGTSTTSHYEVHPSTGSI